MSAISTILTRLRAAIWAIDVRDDIANAIEQCYSDVSNPTLKTEALEAALQTKIDAGQMAALTIGDGTITGAKLANGTIPKAKLDPSITFDADATFDTTSTNAIQNKVVAGAISTLQADLGAQVSDINKLYELLNATSVITGSLISGFNSEHTRTTNPSASPFIYSDFTPDNPYTVKSIKLNVLQTGSLTISKILKEDAIEGGTADRSKFIDLHTFNVTSLGVQTLTIPNGIIIDTDHYLSIGKNDDGCRWKYGTGGDSGFSYVNTSNNTFAHNGVSLGVDVIGTITNINYRKVIKSIITNKKISILGDSISTYTGYIPSGNATYYPRGEITSVDFTWWKEVIDACSLILSVNNSWSGSRVTTTNGEASAGCMARTENLGNPDIIIIYMGINDFNADIPIGSYDGHSAVPTDTTLFETAYAIMLSKVLTNYKSAKVYTCTLIPEERNLSTGFPELNSNGDSLTDYNETIKRISDIFNVEVLDIAKCGMTYQNMSVFNPDMLHPNKAGHALIANYIINKLDNAVSDRY